MAGQIRTGILCLLFLLLYSLAAFPQELPPGFDAEWWHQYLEQQNETEPGGTEATGSVTLNWLPPTTRVDGSALLNLAGFRLYAGREMDALSLRTTLDNPGLTRYVVDELATGTWWFALTAFDTNGLESDRTPPIARVAR